MKPATFNYHRAEKIEDALVLLDRFEDQAKIIAGGQSLIPTMNMRLATPEALIDINKITDLNYIKKEENLIKIGALTRQSDVESSEIIGKYCGLLKKAINHVGHVQTRNRGTIGGSIVHADPTAEIPLALIALNGDLEVTSLNEKRIVNSEDFFITYLTTEVMPNELLTEIQIPLIEKNGGYAFAEISRRHGDFALVASACVLTIDKDENITSLRLTLGGVDSIPLLVEEASEVLIGEKLSEALIEKITENLPNLLDPESDIHASADYRTHIAKVLTKKVLKEAYEHARRDL